MPSLRAIGTYAVALCAAIANLPSPVAAAPTSVQPRQASSGYWMAGVKRQGTAWGNEGYTIFRNVMDEEYGAKGDGVTDDTDAINKAISASNGAVARCGNNPYCDSRTNAPAIVYFPPGIYKVSKPIIMLYYTQLVGDPTNVPTIAADPNFQGMALLDSDPYIPGANGAQYWTNQNNFFRQVRNFIIDLTPAPENMPNSGIHWQVAQATSLQNIYFKMHAGSPTNQQQGIFMDNGSGGFFSNLTFDGGNRAAFLGSQQFTTRNLIFKNCNTGIYMNWNWGWTISNAHFTDCIVGVDMANSPQNQTVGSVVLSDSSFSGVAKVTPLKLLSERTTEPTV